MLSNTLVTNEVKNAAGTEVEFSRILSTARSTEFQASAEAPNLPHRLKISHQEMGKDAEMRRRSVIRFDKSVAGVSGTTRVISTYRVVDIPVGDIADFDDVKDVIAEAMSFEASLGANTTILYDCTGNGAVTLINGSL